MGEHAPMTKADNISKDKSLSEKIRSEAKKIHGLIHPYGFDLWEFPGYEGKETDLHFIETDAFDKLSKYCEQLEAQNKVIREALQIAIDHFKLIKIYSNDKTIINGATKAQEQIEQILGEDND